MKSVRFSALALAVLLVGAMAPASARDIAAEMVVAAAPQGDAPKEEVDEASLSPEQRMNRRFPQPVRVGDLVGLPVLDWSDATIGYIQQVVRTPAGKVQLVVPYRRWLRWVPPGVIGWGTRPVAVPIETVAILGKQVAALEMPPEDFDAAPTFAASQAAVLSPDDRVRIAITRR